MSVEFYRGSPGKFDSRTLIGKLLIGGLGVFAIYYLNITSLVRPYIYIYIYI